MSGKGGFAKLTVVTTVGDDVEADDDSDAEMGGTMEPPVTPIGRDELALRRHRFFNDLMAASQGIHRVRFDPRGPSISGEQEEIISHCQELEALVGRLEAVTSRLEEALSQASSFAVPEVCIDVSRSVSPAPSTNMSSQGFRDIMQDSLAKYVQISREISGVVAQHAELVLEAFKTQLWYIEMAGSTSEPGQSEQAKLLAPLSSKIQDIQSLRDANRTSEFFNHLSAISESIPALGWVTVKPAPAPYVKEMSDTGKFYTNRVLKDWKQKDQKHVGWVNAWVDTLSDLYTYVKAQHTTGLVWGKGGSGPPPPPPPGGLPPPPLPIDNLTTNAGVTDDRSALFAQINQGENITKNLKKVSSDMQTHKNPALRSGPAPFKAPAKASTTPHALPGAPEGAATVKHPVFSRDGKKWLIEHFKGKQDIVVEHAEMNNVVYMFGCVDSILKVQDKINSVIVDSCKRTSVLVDSLVSSIEFINCQSVKMQVEGKVPTITIDKTDGCQIYLSNQSLDVEIVSSKSSEMNVLIPAADGEYTELPVPEQYKTLIVGKTLTTTPVEFQPSKPISS